MKKYEEMSREELLKEKAELEARFKEIKEMGLNLNMARGKPEPAQLDMTMDMFDLVNKDTVLEGEDGTDLRNYGVLTGLPEARKLMSEVLECEPDEVIIGGNASLNLMFDCVSRAMSLGVLGGTPWSQVPDRKWLCPVPGYDRHFAITELFGFEMINIPMKEDGPDMDMVEKLVSEDPSIKGIWCVPKYANPTGTTYSDEVVKRFAALKPAASDFRIFWDNAYAVHDLDVEDPDVLLPLLPESKKNGTEDMVYMFTSTSKITFAGAGISAMGASKANIDSIKAQLTIQTIGYNKINQYMHVKYLKDREGVKAHMAKHAAMLKPKFLATDSIWREEIAPLGLGKWTLPKGGYFICFYALNECAKRIVALAKEAGVTLTGAGAPFPYKKDPDDCVIRIAPSYPSVEEMRQATEIFACCVKLASVEKFLAE